MINLELNVQYKAKEFFMSVIGEEPAKNTCSKSRQKKLAEEKCKFIIEGKGKGTKYIIMEIYTQQRVKLNGKYAEDMKTVLIYLLQNNNRNIVAPKSVLMSECGFVNEKYLDAKRKKKKTAKENDVLLSSTVMFLQLVDALLGQSIQRTIGYLEDASYIIVKPKKRCKFIVTETEMDDKGNPIYIDGKIARANRNVYMFMDEEQEELLSEVIREVLNDMNIRKQSDLYKNDIGKRQIFYNKVNEKIANTLVNSFTKNIINSKKNWLNVKDKDIEIKFDYYYEVYDIKANRFIDEFDISETDFKNALHSINELSEQSIMESMNNTKTLSRKIEDLNNLNIRYKEENNIERLSKDIKILIEGFIRLNIK